MKLRKTILLAIMISTALGGVYSQNKKLDFFGSYTYGFGSITAKVNSALGYPGADEVSKLRSGSMNQIEIGVFYHSFGLGVIHNAYLSDVSTSYENADLNEDARLENGVLSDKLNLGFNGLELLYKLPVLRKKIDVTWKIGLGFQSYSIDKTDDIMGVNPSHYTYTLTGNKFTTMAGVEINYQLLKNIGIGLETSILPGNYDKLKNASSPSYIYSDNVTRLSTGLKIKVTI